MYCNNNIDTLIIYSYSVTINLINESELGVEVRVEKFIEYQSIYKPTPTAWHEDRQKIELTSIMKHDPKKIALLLKFKKNYSTINIICFINLVKSGIIWEAM